MNRLPHLAEWIPANHVAGLQSGISRAARRVDVADHHTRSRSREFQILRRFRGNVLDAYTIETLVRGDAIWVSRLRRKLAKRHGDVLHLTVAHYFEGCSRIWRHHADLQAQLVGVVYGLAVDSDDDVTTLQIRTGGWANPG
jgi:hypothetical protein